MLKGIIFDLDGTLTVFTLDYMSAKRDIVNFLAERGINIGIQARRIVDIIEEAQEKLESQNRDSEFEEIKRTAYKIVEKYEHEAAEKTELHPGALKILKKVKGLGLKVGVVTNNNKKVVYRLLKKLGIESYFDVAICREDVSEYKPNPDPVKKAIEKMSLKPEEAACVGDSIIDIVASNKAGLTSIAVLLGVAEKKELIEYKPDFMAEDLFEVMEIIDNILDSEKGASAF